MSQKLHDTEYDAKKIRRIFADRDIERTYELDFEWPKKLRFVGTSVAVAYRSDKWKPKGLLGRRRHEDYKHVAESQNYLLVQPRLLDDAYGWTVSLEDWPMPSHVAVLGDFLEIDAHLLNAQHELSNVVKLTIPGKHYLGASLLKWSAVNKRSDDQVFLFVYGKQDGVHAIIVGDGLGVGKDGIFG